ncbi:N-terminal phage integrase SAM-like domain-containing protein [Faecalicatena fissicatena]|uniref:N-terminal phage integrase SAM-like domain-containing protein n=1 Tax=Faecalicatena fissicatena TaxID=290055 RepID=UPI001FBB6586|nr:N-terminal phage integrase SAM-like domain-containing protein [Faecalicatena fissicatena]
MSRRGENIYKRKDGRWEGRYIKGYAPDKKAIYGYVYAKSYREVRNRMVFLKKDIKNEHLQISKYKEGSLLLQNIAEDWLIYMKHQIKDSTYIKYRNMIQSYILPGIGTYPI